MSHRVLIAIFVNKPKNAPVFSAAPPGNQMSLQNLALQKTRHSKIFFNFQMVTYKRHHPLIQIPEKKGNLCFQIATKIKNIIELFYLSTR
ncbi:hypothetical protein BGP75_09035 [Motiliproteus sp. MSK22-1]|nr:hypothetical protein BGP75_09035 [Motiliproteus sp. MSK22-1]